MKNLIIISAATMLFLSTVQMCGCGCKANAQTTAPTESLKGEPKTVTLKVTGMTCGGCANNIHTALSKKDGILENEVKYPGDIATVKYNPDKITEKEIITSIEKAGYKAEIMKDDNKKEGTIDKKCEPGCGKSCCSKKKGGC